jgi:MoaA/NifB/PqqE/SkfB family radical SAM enzyme
MNLKLRKKVKQAVKLTNGFWRYNVESKLKPIMPTSMMINLTYKCNSQCVMCNIWQMQPRNEMTLNEWEKALQDPIFSNIQTLTVSGGEAFLFKDYFEAIKLFIDSMPSLNRLVLNTNGFLSEVILDQVKKVAEYCKFKKITLMVSVSIDGVAEVHDQIRRVKDGFKKADKTIDGLVQLSKKYNFKVGIASLLLRQNIDKYDEVKAWMKSKKTDAYSFQIVGFHETFVNNLDSEKRIGFNAEVRKKLLHALNDLSKPKNIKDLVSYYWADMKNMYQNNGLRTTPCPFLVDEFVMDSLGDVYYCLSTNPIGNIIKEGKTVGEIYFDKKNLKQRQELRRNQCKKCNSGCDTYNTLAFDVKKYLWFRVTKKIWPKSI